MLQPEARPALIDKIIEMRDPTRFVMSLDSDAAKQLTQGGMVVTGPQVEAPDNSRRLGYCVQVRKGCGQFGSDMVFLRHPDGVLVTHENQHFYRMTPEQEAFARPLFDSLPESEDYSGGFSCCDNVREVGFIIENSASRPMPDTSFGITVTHHN